MIRTYTGPQAQQLLSVDSDFGSHWVSLHQACPWGTCFQDVPFVTTWYRCYADQYEPVLVTGETNGQLSGLFTLACDKGTGSIHIAGTHQAEYHTWLARPADGDQFIEEALEQLARAFPRGHLQLLFVPPNTPLGWTKNWAGRCYFRAIRRPLLATQPANSVRESLRKKSNKSRLSRMEKEGAVTFTRITDPREFSGALEDISSLSDFRQGGKNAVLPFHADPLKKAFYIAMMEQSGLLHATVLRVGGQLAAAHIGQCNRGELVLGILAHSPFFARHSAGKLHLMMLGLRLEREGFRALDLTPGEEFKDRFATHYDEAYFLQVFFSPWTARAFRTKRALIDLAKRFVGTHKVKGALHGARRRISLLHPADMPGKLWRLAKRFCYQRREFRLYRYSADSVPQPAVELMRRDCLRDLILYSQAEGRRPSLDEFLRNSATRLEDGEHVYTYVEGGRLAHYGWMVERQLKSDISDVGQEFELPPDSAVLYDFYTHPDYRGRGFYGQALAQIAYDAAMLPGTSYVYIGALSDNAPSRHVIEKAGFQYQMSLFQRRLLGTVKRW